MLFSSYKFIFLFFPIVFGLYFAINRLRLFTAAKTFLIAASLCFFAQGSAWFLPLFIITTVFNYGISRLVIYFADKNHSLKVFFFVIGILENIGLLCYYKYSNFFLQNINRAFALDFPRLDIILPIGISFFTFRLIAFLADSYRGKTNDCGIIDYLLFTTFFPQLIIGPITRYDEIVPQFRDVKNTKVYIENIKKGLFIFSIGLGKKVILASPLITFTNDAFNSAVPLSPLASLAALLANLFSYYFDFSGYVDMAIGVGLCFNIALPENFNSPLKARNIQDYWQRRHITLSKFLTEFIFKNIYNPARGIVSFCFAAMVTFLVSGFWHGAGWNYIIWGLIHGAFVCGVGVAAVYSSRKHILPRIPAQIITFVILLFLGGLFVANGTSEYIGFLKNMFNISYYSGTGLGSLMANALKYIAENYYALILIALCFFISLFTDNTREIVRTRLNSRVYIVLAGVVFIFSMFMMSAASEFLYFKF